MVSALGSITGCPRCGIDCGSTNRLSVACGITGDPASFREMPAAGGQMRMQWLALRTCPDDPQSTRPRIITLGSVR